MSEVCLLLSKAVSEQVQMNRSYRLMRSFAGLSDQPSVNSSPACQSDPVPSGRGGGGKGVGKGKGKGDSGGTN